MTSTTTEGTTTMDLTTATPVEIDTALAEIYQRLYRVQDQIAQHDEWIADYERGLEKYLTAGDRRYAGYTQERLDDLEDKVATLRDDLLSIHAETTPYQMEFDRRGGWSRFFHVTNSNGHIHSSMSCSTCFPTTRYAWLTEMSGQSEAEALEALGKAGHVLCSVCFPNAPSEYYTKRQDPSICTGSGQGFDSALPHRIGYYSGNWATCPDCGTRQTVTKTLVFRKHKKPEA